MPSPLLTLHHPARAKRYYELGYWKNQTIYNAVRVQAERRPDAVAVRELTGALSYRQLVEEADQLANYLYGLGLRAGDRVGFWAPSSATTAVCLLACSRDRLICVPSLHRDHTVGDVAALMESVSARAILVDPLHGADAAREDALAVLATSVDAVLDIGQGKRPWAEPAPATQRTWADDPDTISYIAFTSGSTGKPKAVMHSDNTLLAHVRAMIADWDFTEESVVYSLSPLSHNLGFGGMILALTCGGELIVHDLPKGKSIYDRVVETGTTFIFGVPTHAVDLLAEMERREADRLGEVRGFRVSGAAIAQHVAEKMITHGIKPQSGYGMTEGGSHHYTRPGDSPQRITSSSGRPYDGFETRIVSSEDSSVVLGPEEVGQISVRGPSTTLGYFDNQKATQESFDNEGWLQTGDVGWQDEDGYIRITGRKKDIVVRGGHNIFPAKIESLASRFHAVKSCAVVPVPDDRLGEKACLVVASGEGAPEIDADALLHHLDQLGLSKYDMPEYLAEIESIPVLPSGKPAKNQVKELVDEGKIVPRPVRFRPRAEKE